MIFVRKVVDLYIKGVYIENDEFESLVQYGELNIIVENRDNITGAESYQSETAQKELLW